MAVRYGLILLITLAVVENGVARTSGELPGVEEHNIIETNLNAFFDDNKELIEDMIYEKNLDPLEMPDRMLGLPDSLPVAKLHLRNGWVQQLATIKRTGDVLARYHGKNLTVEFDLGWEHIDVNYAYALKALFYTRQGNFHGYFHNVRIAAQGTINLENYNLNMKFFKIIDAGDFRFELSGHLTDYFINLISHAVSVLAKEKIIREIEYYFSKSIQEKIEEINELLPEPMRRRIKYRNMIRNQLH